MNNTYYVIQYRRTCDIIPKWYTKSGLYNKPEDTGKTLALMAKYPDLYAETKVVQLTVNTTADQ